MLLWSFLIILLLNFSYDKIDLVGILKGQGAITFTVLRRVNSARLGYDCSMNTENYFFIATSSPSASNVAVTQGSTFL